MCVFFALFIVTLFTASFTLGRYSSVENSEGDYSGDIEYVVSDQVVIYTVEDFYTAIKNGYSNIKIADSVQDPFIISGTVSEVRTDLTIDLNGHQIQRNSRLPLLQVVQNVYLTILDSKSGGSLYNPVGSVLQVSGGTLTIAAGAYESGPRGADSRNGEKADNYNEYVNTDGTTTPVGARIGNSATLQVTTNNAGQATSSQTVPIIIPSVNVGQEHVTVNGNMYFSTTGYSQNSTLIPADTYLYFTIDSDTVDNTTILSDVGGADYFYSYYLTRNADGNYSYNNNSNTDENAVEVTVFIYNDVKDYITNDRSDHVRTSFAAIEIDSGNLYARNGDYYSYFGVNNTYCVDSEGGYMAVEAGNFYAYENSVCVQCDYDSEAGANEYLNISRGEFYSEVGDTVRVSDARAGSAVSSISIGTAYIVKDSSAEGYAADRQSLHGSAINVTNGNLKISSGADIRLYGSGMNGIFADGGSIEAANAEIHFNDVSSSDGQYVVDQYGAYNFGIFAQGGSITLDGDTGVYVSGTDSAGVYSTAEDGATKGSNITIGGNSFNCAAVLAEDSVLSATAVSTAGGNIIFNVGSAVINSQGLGITASNIVRGSQSGWAVENSGSVGFVQAQQGESRTVRVATPRGTGVYVYGGAIAIGSGVEFTVESNASQNTSWQPGQSAAYSADGIYVQSGSLISNGTLNVKHIGVVNDTEQYEQNGFTYDLTDSNAYINHQIKSYAVRVEGPEGTIDNTNVKIVSGTISNSIGGGLFVANGTVNLSNATVQANGTASDRNYTSYTFNSNWTYYASMYGGHAVEVENGILNICSGQYSSNQGNGILVRNGNVRIENGIFKGNDFQSSAGAGASYAFKMYGGTVTITDGIFGNSTELGNSTAGGAFVMGVLSLATANIDGGDFVVGGSTGFSVYTNSAVRFGGENGNTIPYVSGVSTGLAIENSSGNPSTITINNGVFESTETDVNNHDYNKHGIAFLDGAATLTIAGGQFVSQLGSGLYFSAQPSNNNANIAISGGEFFGNVRGAATWWEDYGGAISGASNFSTNNMFDSTFYGYKAGSGNYWSGWNIYSWRVSVTKGEQDSSTHKYSFSVELYAEDGSLNEISSNNYGNVSDNINDNNCAGYTYITTTNYGT